MRLEALGKHLILELKQCDKTLLNDIDYVKDSMMEAARTIGATILDETFHKFSPLGVTGVVAIAESQTGIYPVSSPGGWRLIGRTPVKMFDPGSPRPTLVEPGDFIRFRPVCAGEFEEISNLIDNNQYQPELFIN